MAAEKSPTFREQQNKKRRNSGEHLKAGADPELLYNPKQMAALENWMRVVLEDEKEEMDADTFFESLRDGTRLCALLNRVKENTISEKKIKKREQLQAHDKESHDNLKLFFLARANNYGLRTNFTKFDLMRCCDGVERSRRLVVQSLYELAVILSRVGGQIHDKFPVIDNRYLKDASAEADNASSMMANNGSKAKKASKKNVKGPHISAPPDLPEDHGDVQAQKQREQRKRAAAFQPDDADVSDEN